MGGRLRCGLPLAGMLVFTCLLALPEIAIAVDPPVTLGTAGDIACGQHAEPPPPDQCQQAATASLLSTLHPDAIAPLGDNQYETASASEYSQFYAASWGTLTMPVHPVPGNHEYVDPAGNAAGYFGYFGAAAGNPSTGYYSYDLGSWHIVALNSNCNVIGCAAGSGQERWLRADLAAHPGVCTLAYWHHPLFTAGITGGDSNNVATRSFWQALYAHGADVVLNGHDHDYQRFGTQTPGGASDPTRGIREFVVGTGGRNLFAGTSPAANLQRMDTSAFGVLLLTLGSGGYSWRFSPTTSGGFTDSGSASCHEPTVAAPPPAIPPPASPPPPPAPPSTTSSSGPSPGNARLRLLAHSVTINLTTGKGKALSRCDNRLADKCVVSLAMKKRNRHVKIGTATGTIPGGKVGLLSLKLNHAGRLLLARTRSHRLEVAAVGNSKNQAGGATAIQTTLRLIGKARKRA